MNYAPLLDMIITLSPGGTLLLAINYVITSNRYDCGNKTTNDQHLYINSVAYLIKGKKISWYSPWIMRQNIRHFYDVGVNQHLAAYWYTQAEPNN